jgi:acyl-CoA thioesterase-1
MPLSFPTFSGRCLLLGLLSIVASMAPLSEAAAQRAAFAPIEEDPALPRVLLLGDSISIGYTLDVRKELKGTANVLRPAANCGPTTRGVANLDQWLGDGSWDVIHFNFGLHDLKYIGPSGDGLAQVDAPQSRQQVPLPEYRKHLQQIVDRLQKTGATLIWCSTTPVPEGSRGRVQGDAAKYNAAALEIMQQEGIAVDDLFATATAKLAEIQRPANVHFTSAGSAYLAKQVAAEIRQALPPR